MQERHSKCYRGLTGTHGVKVSKSSDPVREVCVNTERGATSFRGPASVTLPPEKKLLLLSRALPSPFTVAGGSSLISFRSVSRQQQQQKKRPAQEESVIDFSQV